MFGFVGVGAGGSNIADLAVKKGFHSVSINYSSSDLESLENIKEKLKLVGSEGVGKKRDDSIKYMENNYEMIEKFIVDNFSRPSVEIIVVVFSTGGGTGSGVSPFLIELIKNFMPNKTIVGVPIVPDDDEPLIHLYNCVKTFEDLSKVDAVLLPLDNQKIKERYRIKSKKELYERANEELVSLFEKVLRFTEKSSKKGVIDRKDLLNLFSGSGFGFIAELNLFFNETNFNRFSLNKHIQDSWDNSIFSEYNREIIESAGLIVDIPDDLYGCLDNNQIFSTFNSGLPSYLYEGYYNDESGVIFTIATGLDMCLERMNKIEKLIDDKKQREAHSHRRKSYKSSTTFTSIDKNKHNNESNMSKLDILDRFKK